MGIGENLKGDIKMNNPYAPSRNEMIEVCKTFTNEDDMLTYLSECASHDYNCPDKCDNWAMEFLEENEEEIYE